MRFLILAIALAALPAAAQTPKSDDAFAMRWIAFDAKIAGYHGVTVDVQAIYDARLLFEPSDREIVKAQQSVKDLERAVKLQTDRMIEGVPDAHLRLQKAMNMLAVARARLARLLKERQKVVVKPGDCETLVSEATKWQGLALQARDEIAASLQFDYHDADQRRRLEMLAKEAEERHAYYVALSMECDTARKVRDFEAALEAIPATVEKMQEKAKAAKSTAKKGQYGDLGELRRVVMDILTVEAQLQKLGHELAGGLQDDVFEILSLFTGAYANTCDQQEVPLEVVLGLERQMQLSGATPILPEGATGSRDLITCAYRLWEAANDAANPSPVADQRLVVLRNCSLDLNGQWKVRHRGPDWTADGKGDASGLLGTDGITGSYSSKGNFLKSNPLESKGGLSFEGKFLIQQNVQEDSVGRVFSREIALTATETWPPFDFQATHGHVRSRVYISKEVTLEFRLPVKPIRNDRPCDPSKDVWSY